MPDIRKALAKKLTPDATAERCGFITAKGKIIEVPNDHEDPEKGFRIGPLLVLEALEKGYVGTWHTHPKADPNLSGEDYECFMTWDTMVHYIVGIRNKEVVVTQFQAKDGLVIEL